MTEKKNPDYTNSAVSITNAAMLEPLLAGRRMKQSQILSDTEKLQEVPIYKMVQQRQKELAELDLVIKETVDRLGGYQDIAAGLYALFQRRMAVSYEPKAIRQCIMPYAEAVIEEVVNTDKVKGLLKGGLITESEIEPAKLTKETLRFILET